ncbi:ArsR/SmtB family transcription factor [Streptomyces sp. NPDC058231]|uniref:ArsR/SmtB family transcription factor n=1 Tax=Streptomyces sp. NPDC058231 TaxID=3346392 RepID=UPI0036E3752C
MPAELEFSADDLAQMRFAVSPMWEVGTSFKLLNSGSGHPVHRRWIEQVRPRVATAGLDRGWLAELIRPASYVPDFLNPAPAGPAPTLAAELVGILAAPADRVRRDLDRLRHEQGRLDTRLRTLYAQPSTHMARVTEEIETYWDLAVAPYWARIRTVLDADVFHRARQVAEHGAVHLLNDLHTSVGWGDNALRLGRRKNPLSREAAGTGLLLIPSAFTGPVPLTRTAPPEPPQLAYPARGIGSLWEPGPADARALAAVLGRSRTRLLTELDTPASTTRLAQRTGLSPAAVSQFLTALRDAGLVSPHRAGRSVLYARTAVAEALLIAACG